MSKKKHQQGVSGDPRRRAGAEAFTAGEWASDLPTSVERLTWLIGMVPDAPEVGLMRSARAVMEGWIAEGRDISGFSSPAFVKMDDLMRGWLAAEQVIRNA